MELAVLPNSKLLEAAPTPADPLPKNKQIDRPSVVVVRDAAGLTEHLSAWEALVATAIEPNVFYEPWLFLPALQAFGGKDLYFVLVYGPGPKELQHAPVLYGFFPLERRRWYKGLPITTLSLWKHMHCYLCTPLLRKGFAREGLKAFHAWLAEAPCSGALMEFDTISGEGPFHQVLADHVREYECLTFHDTSETRALFMPRMNGDAYLAEAMSSKHRRQLKRKEQQLAAQGRLEYTEFHGDGDREAILAEFLRLEASGWKGKAGSALIFDPPSLGFFLGAARAGFPHGRMQIITLRLDGRPIAQKCELLSLPGVFSFKIAYDEEFARFSPGLLLDVHLIYRWHACPEIRWVDACTRPDNYKFNNLWHDRRMIQTILLATGQKPGGFVVSAAPLLRWVRRLMRGQTGVPPHPRSVG